MRHRGQKYATRSWHPSPSRSGDCMTRFESNGERLGGTTRRGIRKRIAPLQSEFVAKPNFGRRSRSIARRRAGQTTYSVELWFRNELTHPFASVTAYLFSRAATEWRGIGRQNLGVGGTAFRTRGQLSVVQRKPKTESVAVARSHGNFRRSGTPCGHGPSKSSE